MYCCSVIHWLCVFVCLCCKRAGAKVNDLKAPGTFSELAHELQLSTYDRWDLSLCPDTIARSDSRTLDKHAAVIDRCQAGAHQGVKPKPSATFTNTLSSDWLTPAFPLLGPSMRKQSSVTLTCPRLRLRAANNVSAVSISSLRTHTKWQMQASV